MSRPYSAVILTNDVSPRSFLYRESLADRRNLRPAQFSRISQTPHLPECVFYILKPLLFVLEQLMALQHPILPLANMLPLRFASRDNLYVPIGTGKKHTGTCREHRAVCVWWRDYYHAVDRLVAGSKDCQTIPL